MGPDEILPLIRKSVVRVTFNGIEYYGIIMACKADSAFVIVDGTDYNEHVKEIVVQFPDNKMARPKCANCYEHDNIVGMSCYLVNKGEVFDQNEVSAVDVCEDDADQCEKVYVYEGTYGTITDGYAMKIDPQHYRITNNAADGAEYGSPVVNEDGRLVGICCSFNCGLIAKTIVSVADSVETSRHQNFTCLRRTLSYLHTLI